MTNGPGLRCPDCRCRIESGERIRVVSLAEAEAALRDGRLPEAELAFGALAAGPDQAGALHGLGIVHLQRGEPAKALLLLQAAYGLMPDARFGHNLASVLRQVGRIADAIAILRQVVAADPDYSSAHLTLAELLACREPVEAVRLLAKLCERAVHAQRPDVAENAVTRLLPFGAGGPLILRTAHVLRGAGRGDLAIALLQALLKQTPDDLGAELGLVMSELAVVHVSTEDLDSRRRRYAESLDRLDRLTRAAPCKNLAAAAAEIGDAKPFFLSYQGFDDSALQATYGRILMRLHRASVPTPALCAPAEQSGRLRIGFASAYFTLHSVSKLFGGWMRGLDPARFELFAYHFGEPTDVTSQSIRAVCTQYRTDGNRTESWRNHILQDRLHALIYPEIGMHPLPLKLGCERLAPVQCMAWGHPVTSGLPEIDYFLSSDFMEPDDADRHYGETLVRLPNLSIDYAPLLDGGHTLSREHLGLRTDATVYICCQSLFKYLPAYDDVFIQIAMAVPSAQFVFIAFQRAPTALFEARINARFQAHGLDPERYFRIVQPVSSDDFPAFLRAGDVYLDSIGWSGGNTTLEAIACGLPVVTLPTALMRGRHSAAILRQMGLQARIARTLDDYIRLAVRLAETGPRAAFRAEIAARRQRLYGDRAPVRALEDFLEGAVEQTRRQARSRQVRNAA